MFQSVMISPAIRIRLEIKKIAVSMQALYLVTVDGQLLRRVFTEGERLKEFNKDNLTELFITSHQVEDIFIDPSGWHCLVAMEGSTEYVHLSSAKNFTLLKLHDKIVTSVAWDSLATQLTTNEMLLGTATGEIIETAISYDPSTNTIRMTNYASVLELPKKARVFGLQYEKFPGVPMKCSVMAATLCWLFQFSGDCGETRRPNFLKIFEPYRNSQPLLQSAAVEVESNLKTSKLQFYSSRGMRAEFFAWMSGAGIMHGRFPATASEDLQVKQLTQIPYPKKTPTEQPVATAVSAHHAYTLYPTYLAVISKLSLRQVHTINFETRQGYDMIGAFFEQNSHSLFVWSRRFIYQIMIDNEDRDVWKYYIEQKRFEEAVRFCETNNLPSLAKVKAVYADNLFERRKYEQAAANYVHSDRPFEEVALKFMNQSPSLRIYLEQKLEMIPNSMKAQRTLVSTWLVEIHLDIINSKYHREAEYDDAIDKLKVFLSLHKNDLDAMTTYNLLQSHGRIDEWVYFAELKDNIELVILHHINQQQFKKALQKLTCIDPASQEELLYRYAPVFIKNEPKNTVSIMISVGKQAKDRFDPVKVLPALMNVPARFREEAIRFEKFCVDELQSREHSLHDLYLFHLAEGDESQLLKYLKNQERMHEHDSNYDFDLEYGLSVCKNNKKVEAQIFIYSMLKLYSDAVSMALENNKLDLAKENAMKPQKHDEELSRKLWLDIAIHLIKQSQVPAALAVMRESRLIKMEDLLPHFNEKESISQFKDDICSALSDYTEKIKELMEDLNESRASANLVKTDLKTVKQRFIQMEGLQACELCMKPAMKKKFFVFPCAHVFHMECLYNILLKYENKHFANELRTLYRQIVEPEDKLSSSKQFRKSERIEQREVTSIREQQVKLDDMLSRTCYLCSELFIDSINENLLDDARELESWEIS